MGKTQRRIKCKITMLPGEVREDVDALLLDTSNTYEDISKWLKSVGYDISKSAVGRYAIHVNRAAQRVAETLARTNAIAAAVEKNPDIDYTKASRLVLMDGLMQRVSTAEEEFQEMPLDKAGRLIAQLARVDVYEQRVKHDIKSKVDIAFGELETEILKAIKSDSQIASELHSLLERAKEKVLAEDKIK